jgi:hypothetical protein
VTVPTAPGDEELRLRTSELTWRAVDEDIVVLDLRGSTYFSLNSSAAVLWEAIAGGASRAELARCLVDRYGIEAEHAAADVEAFVAELQAKELLEGSG